jgi:hypothetical protein
VVESRPDQNDQRLTRACELLTQVADDLQGDLTAHLRDDIPVARAGAVVRLACQIEQLNQLASQAWEIRQARLTSAQVAARLAAHG